MPRAGQGRGSDEVVEAYARLGVKQWNRQRKDVQEAASDALPTKVAESERAAVDVVRGPFRSGSETSLVLVPMPGVSQRRGLAFFAPIRPRGGEGAVLSTWRCWSIVSATLSRSVSSRLMLGRSRRMAMIMFS